MGAQKVPLFSSKSAILGEILTLGSPSKTFLEGNFAGNPKIALWRARNEVFDFYEIKNPKKWPKMT